MTAKNQATIRLGFYIGSLVVMACVSLYSRGGEAGKLESRVSAVETWKTEHSCDADDSAKAAAEKDTILAVLQAEFKHVRRELEEIKDEIRRSGDIAGSSTTSPPVTLYGAPVLYAAPTPEDK